MPTSKKIILLVDDDELLRDMYEAKFGSEGYEVVSALNGREALTILRDGLVPDAIVFDIVMGVMGGEAFMKTAKEEDLARGSARIALSNSAGAAELDKELDLDGFILKSSSVPTSVVDEVTKIIKKVHKKRGDLLKKERNNSAANAKVTVHEEFIIGHAQDAAENEEQDDKHEAESGNSKRMKQIVKHKKQ